MTTAQREVEVASKLIRLDAKRRDALTACGDHLRWNFKWADPHDDVQTILNGIAQKIAVLWDKDLASSEISPVTSRRVEEYLPSLSKLAARNFPEMEQEVLCLPLWQVVEYLELLARPSSLPTKVGELTVMSGLARLLIMRTVAAAASLDTDLEEPVPFSLRPNENLDWHPAPTAGIHDHAPWVTGVAQLHGCLAGWDAAWTLPPRPPLDADVLPRCAYFAPLALLMFGCLSWINPAVGIARWINLGMPAEDPVLKLVKRQWGKWALAHAVGQDTLRFWTYGDGYRLAKGLTHEQTNLEESARAGRSFLESSEYGRRQLQFAGQLHMQTHIQWQLGRLDGQTPARTLFINGSSAVIALDEYSGWWEALREEGDNLPPLRADDERVVLVLSKGIGLLGEFRHSRVTGRWYVGSHETHLLGWTAP
ncbi:hypothetical protein [Arthrobacter globiformis]|uniref:hypothetical protein n=1 Tax=Arthrobacter globiformis TaxID=1665 RepID=UPI002788FEB2|nr:hypothetical protein [Arthrobacter globiformis]MDQ0863765.1 hypothetical protein [Arthrobacter globiformis]